MMIISSGRTMGDYECVNNVPHQTSMICYSPEASVHILTKNQFIHVMGSNDDSWNFMKEQSDL